MATPMRLEHRQVGPWQMNTYALICPDSNRGVLFDPGDDPDTLVEMLGDSEPVAILLTHTHPDHIGALAEMRERLGVPVYARRVERSNSVDEVLEPYQDLDDGDTFEVGKHRLRVIHTPGHTDDMLSFAIEGDHRIIVGDTIFEGGPGRTWSPDGFQTTLATLRNIVLSWPDESRCYPGHGPDFTIGELRPRIGRFLAKDHGDFYGDAEWEM